jgi:hypothetical protein
VNGRGRDVDLGAAHARLVEAAQTGASVEVILVVRGRVRPVRAPGGAVRWRVRGEGDHVLTFRAESVVAATPLPSAGRRPR